MSSMVTFLDGASIKPVELSKLVGKSNQKAYVITECKDLLIQKLSHGFEKLKVYEISQNAILKPGAIYLIRSGLSYSFNGKKITITNGEADLVWKELIKNVLNEFYLIGADLKIIDANQTALNNLGYRTEDLSQTSTHKILQKLKKTTFIEFIKPLFSDSKSQITFNGEHIRSDGSTYRVDGSFTKIKDQGKVFIKCN